MMGLFIRAGKWTRGAWEDDGSVYAVITAEDWKNGAHTFHVGPIVDEMGQPRDGWIVREFVGQPFDLRQPVEQEFACIQVKRVPTRDEAIACGEEWAKSFNPGLSNI